jgi:hypothetical protein
MVVVLDPSTAIASEWRCSVARYDKEHKQATRQRIIEMAGNRFKVRSTPISRPRTTWSRRSSLTS